MSQRWLVPTPCIEMLAPWHIYHYFVDGRLFPASLALRKVQPRFSNDWSRSDIHCGYSRRNFDTKWLFEVAIHQRYWIRNTACLWPWSTFHQCPKRPPCPVARDTESLSSFGCKIKPLEYLLGFWPRTGFFFFFSTDLNLEYDLFAKILGNTIKKKCGTVSIMMWRLPNVSNWK